MPCGALGYMAGCDDEPTGNEEASEVRATCMSPCEDVRVGVAGSRVESSRIVEPSGDGRLAVKQRGAWPGRARNGG
jgi:hypothetical protein